MRADCEPLELLDFLAGGSAAAASEAAQKAATDKATEEELLNLVGLQSVLSALLSFLSVHDPRQRPCVITRRP